MKKKKIKYPHFINVFIPKERQTKLMVKQQNRSYYTLLGQHYIRTSAVLCTTKI